MEHGASEQLQTFADFILNLDLDKTSKNKILPISVIIEFGFSQFVGGLFEYFLLKVKHKVQTSEVWPSLVTVQCISLGHSPSAL